MITLENIKEHQIKYSLIVKQRLIGNNKTPHYVLNRGIKLKLSDGKEIIINRGFKWDLSSVPRVLWGVLPPDGDFELASLIHDYLYINKIGTRKFADKEMLIWSKVISGTNSKISIRNFDNQIRYIAVRLFGWVVWNKKKRS